MVTTPSVSSSFASRNAVAHLFDVVQARRSDDDRVAKLALHEAVVRDPTERDLREGQSMLSSDDLDGIQRLEVVFVPVSSSTRSAV